MSQVEGLPIATRRVKNRALDPSDYDWLYEVGVQSPDAWRWRHRGSTPSPDSYISSLWAGALVNHISEKRIGGERVAFMSAQRADMRNGHCYIAVIAAPEYVRSVHAAESIGLFLSYLMAAFPFRKLYVEVPEFNARAFGSSLNAIFSLEGRLRDYEYYDGRYWDFLTYSISRQEIETHVRRLVGLKEVCQVRIGP
jgi:RimJ/RimL family protein N-acetyltransferase